MPIFEQRAGHVIRWPLLAACLAFAVQARADESPVGPLAVEAQVSAINAPLGAGLALLYDRDGWFSGGAGFGFDFDRFGLFSRARLFRAGPLRLGVALNLSTGSRYKKSRDFKSDYYADSHMEWYWGSATRLDAGLGAELRWRQFSFRLEGGPAFLLDPPTCDFQSALQSFTGDCDSSAIPAPYHLSPEPGRISSYLMVSLDYRPSVGGNAAPAATSPGSPPPARATSGWTGKNWAFSFLAADGAGLAGGLALGGLAYLLVQDHPHDTEAAANRDIALTLMAVAGSIGFTLGAATGAKLYGRATKRSDGSFAAALFGSLLGMAAASGLTSVAWRYTPQRSHAGQEAVATACVLVPVLPALGATLGYFTSSSPPPPTQLALAQYDPDAGLRLGLPTVLVSRSSAATTVNVPVVAGRF